MKKKNLFYRLAAVSFAVALLAVSGLCGLAFFGLLKIGDKLSF